MYLICFSPSRLRIWCKQKHLFFTGQKGTGFVSLAVKSIWDRSSIYLSNALRYSGRTLLTSMRSIYDDSPCFAAPAAGCVLTCTWNRPKHQCEGILPKGPYLPCLRMADRALFAGYPRHVLTASGPVCCWNLSWRCEFRSSVAHRHSLVQTMLHCVIRHHSIAYCNSELSL